MQKIFDTVGQPRNYGPSSQAVEEEERRKTEERMRRETQEKAEEERREAEEARHRAARWEEWVRSGRRAGVWMLFGEGYVVLYKLNIKHILCHH